MENKIIDPLYAAYLKDPTNDEKRGKLIFAMQEAAPFQAQSLIVQIMHELSQIGGTFNQYNSDDVELLTNIKDMLEAYN